ncbi:hypothetical protein ACRALDRAFT_2114732 [Sodiomyces alcalophilus JCM 7366]|uniref:uncharacterized protein n=1 Tax=Sodiomyces alcalophilus JCM 7366 TaxID=591952 RepID=UPI0039B4E15A
MPSPPPQPPLPPRLPCIGPRGHLLSESPDDALQAVDLDIPYPIPFVGSHAELGLDQTWMTADGRYGPYGYGEDEPSYSRTRVDWDTVDWGALQNQCLDRNSHRFPAGAAAFAAEPVRFAWRNRATVPPVRTWDEFRPTRRTALVVRAYDDYDYKPEDLLHLRSLIVEAGLRTGGEYVVVLLVHIRGRESNIFSSPEAYQRAFKEAKIPKEFQSIAVLWDEGLLESWYPRIAEHRVMWQAFQPVQLFALHYPEFDHYWQLEMDMRFTGDAGVYLDAMDAFSRQEPRKQAVERTTFFYDPATYASYAEFQAAVDVANKGSSYLWGPVSLREVPPLGPEPPTTSVADDFTWGVGEPADVVVTGLCDDAQRSTTWVFRDWFYGFTAGRSTPRFFCAPAIQRGSRALLLTIHALQLRRGLRIASEATLPSFAAWMGLKLSAPPMPWYLQRADNETERALWMRGGVAASNDGWGRSDPQWGVGELKGEPQNGNTWWWTGNWPGDMFTTWMTAGRGEDEMDPTLSQVLAMRDGEVYMPNIALHPVKNQ